MSHFKYVNKDMHSISLAALKGRVRCGLSGEKSPRSWCDVTVI